MKITWIGQAGLLIETEAITIWAVPIHWGMFDNLNPSGFDLDNAVIPNIYEEVKFK